MISRSSWAKTLEEYKENYEILKRESDLWEKEAKRLFEENHKLKATIKLWKGTGL